MGALHPKKQTVGRRAKPPSSEAEPSVILESGGGMPAGTRVGTKKHTKGSEFGARNVLHVVNRDPNVAGSIAHWHAVQRYLRLFAYANRTAAYANRMVAEYERVAAESERLKAHSAAMHKRRLWLIGIGEVAALGALGLAYYKSANLAKFGRPAHLYTN